MAGGSENVPGGEPKAIETGDTVAQSGVNLDHVMAALYKKLDIM